MSWLQNTLQLSSQITRYRLRRIVVISVAWAVIDLILYYRNVTSGINIDYAYHENTFWAYALRFSFTLVVSFIMSGFLLRGLKHVFRNFSLLAGWLIKGTLLLIITFASTILLFFLHYMLIKGLSYQEAAAQFLDYFFYTRLITESLLFWLVMLLSALIIVEIDQRYSPGVFWEIVTGKYLKPRNEKRIIMFLGLNNSTPISEMLGHEKYFLFTTTSSPTY